MKTDEILFILTFVFGIIHTACMCFGVQLNTITDFLVTSENAKKEKGIFKILLQIIAFMGGLFTYFSLCYQVWFWFIVKLQIIK